MPPVRCSHAASILGRPVAGLLVTLLGCGGDDAPATDPDSTGAASSSGAPATVTAADTSSGAIDPSTGTTGDASTGTTGDASTDAGSTDSSTTGDTAGDGLGEDSIARIHDAVEANLGSGYATGCSVAVWRDGAVIYAEGFGTKDEAGDPVSPDTLFQIGSDTKKMTAIALLQQVDAGGVALDTTVAELLPTLDLAASPGAFDTLSIDRLLSHRSGLFDYTPWSEAPDDGELQLRTTTTFAANEYAMMPSGVAFDYSNPNFALAGVLIETLAARPWAEVVIDDIAALLGMDHTYARRDDMLAVELDIASGFGPIYDSDLDTFDLIELFSIGVTGAGWTTPEDHVDNAFTRPAGLVWSTATDMAKLAGFLVEGDESVLSDALRLQMQTGQVALLPGLDPALAGYGYGLMAVRGLNGPQGYRDVPVVQHGGNTLDMTSTFILLPEQGVGLSILSNGAGDDMSLVAAVALEEAAAGRLPEPSDPPTLVEPPADDLSVYAGTFSHRALGVATLTWTGTQLEIDVPLLDALGAGVDPVLTPAYRDVFLMDVGGGQFDLSFYPGLDATPNQYAVNRSFVFTREGAGAPVGPRLRAPGRAPLRFDRTRPLSLPRWR